MLLVLTLDLPAIVKSVQVNTVPLWTIQPLFKNPDPVSGSGHRLAILLTFLVRIFLKEPVEHVASIEASICLVTLDITSPFPDRSWLSGLVTDSL